MGVITGKPPAFNTCSLLFFQNLSLLMRKCKANVLEFDSASREAYHMVSHVSFDFGCDEEEHTWLDRPLLSSHAAICASSYQGN